LLKKPPVNAHEEHERCGIAAGSGPSAIISSMWSPLRYRCIVKNHHWHLAAFALVNLYQHRKRLIRQLAPLAA
jgi:hypothetical protein